MADGGEDFVQTAYDANIILIEQAFEDHPTIKLVKTAAEFGIPGVVPEADEEAAAAGGVGA